MIIHFTIGGLFFLLSVFTGLVHQKVGFRFITKFGTKGLVNLGKMLPGVGALVGGSLDLVETKLIANRAYNWFVVGNFENNSGEKNDDTFVVEVETEDFE